MKPYKLEQEIVDLIVPRIGDEYKAFYHYKAAANWCKNVGYFKAAEFFEKESQNELTHAETLQKYLIDWNITPPLESIQGAKVEFKDLVELINESYSIEYQLYEDYEDTAAKVMKLGDVCTFNFLLPFNKIQQDSVAEYSDKLNMLEGVEATKFNLLLLEKKLF